MQNLTLAMAAAALLAASGATVLAGHPPQGHDPEASADLKKALMRGKEDDDVKTTGDVDKDYAALMIEHHQAAIDMNRILIEKGHDPALKALAQKMTAQQQKEIRDLERFSK
jgi:uncharacterized protein (DUF305 family)